MNKRNVITYATVGIVLALGATLFVSLFIYLFVWIPSSFEAKSFNKFSTIKATTWDAIWTDLKVTSQ